MKSVIAFCTFVAMVAAVQPVYGAIDFEDLYPGYETDGYIPAGYAGFDWSNDAKWKTSLHHPGTGYEYGTIGHVSLYNAYADSISMGGRSFDFMDAYITSAWNIDQDFTVEGWRSGSMVYSSYQTTSYDMPYWFQFNFYDVDTIWFIPGTDGTNAGLGGSGHHLVIDNIVIPEPATLLLFGLGVPILLQLRRRR